MEIAAHMQNLPEESIIATTVAYPATSNRETHVFGTDSTKRLCGSETFSHVRSVIVNSVLQIKKKKKKHRS